MFFPDLNITCFYWLPHIYRISSVGSFEAYP
jgi:hypothetical protein